MEPSLPPPLLRVRPNVEQSNIPALAAAYTTTQALPEGDNRSWVYWGEFHGYNRYDCWHHGNQGGRGYPYDLFLPWHRAYLMYFELEAMKFGAPPLPWWDWTSATSHQVGIPTPFKNEPPLASGPVPGGLRTNPPRTTRSPGSPARLPSLQTIEGILALSSFEDFSNQLQNQHDLVHGWVRGDMGTIVRVGVRPDLLGAPRHDRPAVVPVAGRTRREQHPAQLPRPRAGAMEPDREGRAQRRRARVHLRSLANRAALPEFVGTALP